MGQGSQVCYAVKGFTKVRSTARSLVYTRHGTESYIVGHTGYNLQRKIQ